MNEMLNTTLHGAVPARLKGLTPYSAGGADPRINLRLDANEGRPDGRLLAALARLDERTLREYPKPGALEARLAARLRVDPACVVVTNGGDDAIDRVCRATLETGRTALLHTPTFEMIERSVRLAGGIVAECPWLRGAFPVDAIVAAIEPRTALVALVSPNNPTGGVIGTDDMLRVVEVAARVGAVVLVDLAYVEFADEDPTPRLIAQPNVVVVRTFSKAFGLAGLRVGYAVAHENMARRLRTVGGPYPVSGISLALAAAAITLCDERDAWIERVRQERQSLTRELRELGCDTLDSQANFVLTRPPGAAAVRSDLAAIGIGVRGFGGRPGLQPWLRISLPGDAAAFDRLGRALRTALSPPDRVTRRNT